MMDQLPRRLDLRRHGREAKGDGLMLGDRPSKGYPLARIVAGGLESGAGHADRLGGDADPAALSWNGCSPLR